MVSSFSPIFSRSFTCRKLASNMENFLHVRCLFGLVLLIWGLLTPWKMSGGSHPLADGGTCRYQMVLNTRGPLLCSQHEEVGLWPSECLWQVAPDARHGQVPPMGNHP